MKIYRLEENAVLSHEAVEGEIARNNLKDAVVSIEPTILDTNNPEQMHAYQTHLKDLIEKAKKDGEVHDFRLIREDDLFPYDWKWRANNKETYREFAKSNFAYYLRMEEAKRRVPVDDRFASLPFEVPHNEERIQEEALKLGPYFGRVYEPVKFRSTKHFTMNTPLAYTGDYNQVESNRRFVVIDTVDAFCDSGYGYSADYKDAYLDISHEELPISKDAIVLISEENYQEIIKDPVIQKQLPERRVVLYRGNEAMAINMVLVSEGVLPYRFQGKYYQYDSDLDTIMTDSMKRFCSQNDLEYSHNHGNLFGKGGHFTDLLDSRREEDKEFPREFSKFLQEQMPEYSGLLSDTFYRYSYRSLPKAAIPKLVNAVSAYNEWAHEDEVKRREEYDLDRSQITPEIHTLFVDTVKKIREYCTEHPELPDDKQKLFQEFFDGTLFSQVRIAQKIQEVLSEEKQY